MEEVDLSSSRLRYRRATGFAVLALLFASLFLPALQYGAGYNFSELHWNPGWSMFMLGPLGLLMAEFAWYANPILAWAAIQLVRGRRVGPGWGLAAFFLAASVMLEVGRESCLGGCSKTLALGSGYYLWLGAAGLLLLFTALDVNNGYKSAARNF